VKSLLLDLCRCCAILLPLSAYFRDISYLRNFQNTGCPRKMCTYIQWMK
jgi:hypothetical protein